MTNESACCCGHHCGRYQYGDTGGGRTSAACREPLRSSNKGRIQTVRPSGSKSLYRYFVQGKPMDTNGQKP
jgi:hypothetical protein